MTEETQQPLAYAADVSGYLDRIEALVRENARLRAMLGYMLAVCRSVSGQVANNDISGDWCQEVLDPFVAELQAELKK